MEPHANNRDGSVAMIRFGNTSLVTAKEYPESLP